MFHFAASRCIERRVNFCCFVVAVCSLFDLQASICDNREAVVFFQVPQVFQVQVKALVAECLLLFARKHSAKQFDNFIPINSLFFFLPSILVMTIQDFNQLLRVLLLLKVCRRSAIRELSFLLRRQSTFEGRY